jgi:hypothetical protein
MERLGALLFALVGVVLVLNVGGVAVLLAEMGRRQRRRWGLWLTAGTPQTATAVRLLGVAFIVLGLGIAAFPPT